MKIRASVRKICTKCRLIRRHGRKESFVPIRSINKDRGNLSKKELSFLKSKKSTHRNVQIPNQKMKVKDIFNHEP